MNTLDKPSKFELLTGNLITEAGMTTLAAYFATPLAALLPVLSNSLASGRHQKRIEKALSEINKMLTEHEKEIRNLTDAQYKIINETILTILQTVEKEKLKYLKSAIKNSIKEEKVPISLASQISRILRDISVDEILFLVRNSKYSSIVFSKNEVKYDTALRVDPYGKEGVILSGLVALGLMVPGASTFDNIGRYEFSPLVKKLLVVIST